MFFLIRCFSCNLFWFLRRSFKISRKFRINLSDSKFKADIIKDGGVLQGEIERLIGVKEVNCSIDCIGYEATKHGHKFGEKMIQKLL